MQYNAILPAIFLARPNRFIAHILLNGCEEICHVKNTGRCAELLVPGAEIYVQKNENPARKTKFDLICVKKGERLINMDSAAPNRIAMEWLEAGGLSGPLSLIRPETTHEDSRFDFYIENDMQKAFIEVKGVTLEENGLVRFPDAPTLRGVKHVEGLCRCVEQGFGAYLLFVVQMQDVHRFVPNDATQPAFGQALRKAKALGVKLLAYDCTVTPDSLRLRAPVCIDLS